MTLWDNRNYLLPQYSRAVEYQLDEIQKTATLVWQYRNTPDSYSPAMGNMQRLANGNSMTGWGLRSSPTLIEVKPDNSKAFQLSFASPLITYRAFRFAWQGYPDTNPTLVAQTNGVTTTLAYSWNGATEIAAYRVYADATLVPSQLIATQPKTAFEEHTLLFNAQQYCVARIMPIDKDGRETRYSNIISLNPNVCKGSRTYLPVVAH